MGGVFPVETSQATTADRLEGSGQGPENERTRIDTLETRFNPEWMDVLKHVLTNCEVSSHHGVAVDPAKPKPRAKENGPSSARWPFKPPRTN